VCIGHVACTLLTNPVHGLVAAARTNYPQNLGSVEQESEQNFIRPFSHPCTHKRKKQSGYIRLTTSLVSRSQAAFFHFYLCQRKKGSGYLGIYFLCCKLHRFFEVLITDDKPKKEVLIIHKLSKSVHLLSHYACPPRLLLDKTQD